MLLIIRCKGGLRCPYSYTSSSCGLVTTPQSSHLPVTILVCLRGFTTLLSHSVHIDAFTWVLLILHARIFKCAKPWILKMEGSSSRYVDCGPLAVVLNWYMDNTDTKCSNLPTLYGHTKEPSPTRCNFNAKLPKMRNLP